MPPGLPWGRARSPPPQGLGSYNSLPAGVHLLSFPHLRCYIHLLQMALSCLQSSHIHMRQKNNTLLPVLRALGDLQSALVPTTRAFTWCSALCLAGDAGRLELLEHKPGGPAPEQTLLVGPTSDPFFSQGTPPGMLSLHDSPSPSPSAPSSIGPQNQTKRMLTADSLCSTHPAHHGSGPSVTLFPAGLC